MKIIMTGSADDGPEWQPHIRNKEKRRTLANRFKDSKDPFRIVIVRDMWLTGFDAPCLHTMATNESALTAMGDDKLNVIAAELIKMVRKSVTIDWTLRETTRAKIRVIVKRILNKWGYPPDLQDEAVKTVLRQAELLCEDWSGDDKGTFQ